MAPAPGGAAPVAPAPGAPSSGAPSNNAAPSPGAGGGGGAPAPAAQPATPTPVAHASCLFGTDGHGGCVGGQVFADYLPAALLTIGAAALAGSGTFLQAVRGTR